MRAAEFAGPHVRFQVQDLRDWRPETSVDVIISNATFQWVPGHRALLPSLSPGSPQTDGWPFKCRETSTSPVIGCFASCRRPTLCAHADRSRLAGGGRRGLLSR